MGETDPFTQFYPTGFTQWVKLTVPTLHLISDFNTSVSCTGLCQSLGHQPGTVQDTHLSAGLPREY